MIELNKLIKDDFIYPRKQVSQKTVDSYIEALEAGAKFPAVLIQKVKKEKEEEIIIIDGFHRVEAYKEYNRKKEIKKGTIEAKFWKDETIPYEENKILLKLESSRCNIKHGDRLTNSDKENVACSIAEIDSEIKWTEQKIADSLGVAQPTVSDWISIIRAKQKLSRESLIYHLHFLGWTQEEIAEAVGLDQSVISRIMQNIRSDSLHNEIEGFLKQGRDMPWIAEHYGFSLLLAWAIRLQGKDDVKRFGLFGRKEFGSEQPKLTDYWKFQKGDLRLGEEYDGRTWGQETMNILYRYSKQKDLVVDPMAGGGVTPDACLVMNRSCRAYDTKPHEKRKDIIEHDITKGYPDRCRDCDLIILDPPYYKKEEKVYDCNKFTKDRKTFLLNMEKLARDSYKVLKSQGYFALLYGQWLDYKDESRSILTFDLDKLFQKAGFRKILNIQSPLIFDIQYQPFHIERAKKKDPWQVLPVSRDWSIFRKS